MERLRSCHFGFFTVYGQGMADVESFMASRASIVEALMFDKYEDLGERQMIASIYLKEAQH